MNQIWTFCFDMFSSAGVPKLWAETGAGGVCALAVLAVAVFVCLIMNIFVRKLIVRKVDGLRHREKAMSFASAARRFVFAWILSAWLPGCFRGVLAAARPVTVVLEITVIVLCASALSAAIAWLQSVAKMKTGDKTFSSKTFAQVAKIVV
jgi:biotin transporter BioY